MADLTPDSFMKELVVSRSGLCVYTDEIHMIFNVLLLHFTALVDTFLLKRKLYG